MTYLQILQNPDGSGLALGRYSGEPGPDAYPLRNIRIADESPATKGWILTVAGDLVAPAPPPAAPVPVVAFAIETIGPDAAAGYVDGPEATVIFSPGPDGRSLNGIRAVVLIQMGGMTLDGQDGRPSFDRAFRMPFQPVDALGNPAGTPVVKLIQFKKGAAVVEFFPEQPCSWIVSQEIISRDLKPAEAMILPATVRIVAVRL